MFENLWNSAIPAQFKIKEIEEGVKPPFLETLRDPIEIQKVGFNLVGSAKQEIQMLLYGNSNNTFLREERKQLIIQLFKVAMLHGIRVRILTSKDVQKLIEELTERQQKIVKTIARKEKNEKGKEEEDIGGSVAASAHTQGKFEIHLIDKLQQQKQTNVSILIVDSKVCLVEDLKAHEENNNNNSDETLPLATYSNRESTVLTYTSIFETLWTQTQLRIHRVSDKLKQH